MIDEDENTLGWLVACVALILFALFIFHYAKV